MLRLFKPLTGITLITLLLLSGALWKTLYAQSASPVADTSVPTVLFTVNLGYHLPEGDLKPRYGHIGSVGGSAGYKTASNYVFTLMGEFLYSSRVKEIEIFQQLFTSSGYLIGREPLPPAINFSMHGFSFRAEAGKIFPLIGPNPNSGIFFKVGAGILQHKIHINVNEYDVPHLAARYQRGYDRLTNGFSTSQFLGYIHFSGNKLMNYYIGVEFTQGWTRNRRPLNFDTMERADQLRTDYLIGLKAGWMLPLYRQVKDKFYYY